MAALAIVIAVASGLLGQAPAGAQSASGLSIPVYFDETGQVLSGVFLDVWFQYGGPDRTGFPVTPPTKLGDRWVQWFEYARLEVVAETYESGAADAVQLTPVGSSYARSFGYVRSHAAFARIESPGGEARYFEESGHAVANGFLEAYELNSNGERLGNPISEEFSINGTIYQFFEYGALSWTEMTGTVLVPVGTLDAMINGKLGDRAAQPEHADVYSPGTFALRSQYPGERWIEINTSAFTLTAWEGDTPVMSTLVVTGAPISPTVEGEFSVYWKLKSQTMAGVGVDGVRYEQPDVPDVMYFFEDWAIHGSYWRRGFGYAASHGCVNVPLAEAAWLWDWASVGTRVVVHS